MKANNLENSHIVLEECKVPPHTYSLNKNLSVKIDIGDWNGYEEMLFLIVWCCTFGIFGFVI